MADQRHDYGLSALEDLAADVDPLTLFDAWLADARGASGIDEPTAMTLATMDEFGPDARIVLMRGRDERGLRFFTNVTSAKGLQLAGAPRAACVFHWQPLQRQVRIRGPVERLPDADSDAYWAGRPVDSQVASAMSEQSRPIESREALADRMATAMARFGGAPITRPDTWGGYRVVPHDIEFWQGRPARLHDRILFTAHDEHWERTRLQP